MPDGVSFDQASLDKLARRLREVTDRSSPEMSKAVWQLGAELAVIAKMEARAHSQTIPGTIRMVPLPGEADVIAGNKGTPLAVLYEFGNKKKAKRGVKFAMRATGLEGPVTREQSMGRMSTRKGFGHPVFGNREVWVVQESHPYLRPAFRVVRRHMKHTLEAAEREMLRPLRES